MSQVTNDLPVAPPEIVRIILSHRRKRLAAEAEAKQKNTASATVSQAGTLAATTPRVQTHGDPQDNTK